jgi:hypothetical protein
LAIDYLSGKKQRVVIRGEKKSQWLNVYSGVPWGSVIGPILSLICINDLPTGIKSRINIFADDTEMARKVGTAEHEKIVSDDLEALQNWSNSNGMKFSVNTTNTESRTRGHVVKLKISRSKIEIRRNFFTNRRTKIWTGLSQEIINSKTIDAFKRANDQENGLHRRCSTTSSKLTAVNQP